MYFAQIYILLADLGELSALKFVWEGAAGVEVFLSAAKRLLLFDFKKYYGSISC